jgi:hypothetical protein
MCWHRRSALDEVQQSPGRSIRTAVSASIIAYRVFEAGSQAVIGRGQAVNDAERRVPERGESQRWKGGQRRQGRTAQVDGVDGRLVDGGGM